MGEVRMWEGVLDMGGGVELGELIVGCRCMQGGI